MGFEILWFRHFTLLLGGFRAIFSLLLTVILTGIAAGSLLGSVLLRRDGNPARWLILAQALFVSASLAGLAAGNAGAIRDSIAGAATSAATGAGEPGAIAELWFNLAPILIGVALPALLMGFAYPLGNAMIQRAESGVGRRAGILYLSNTAGAVCGSLAAGFVMLPMLGIQGSAAVLAAAAALVIVPVSFAAAPRPAPWIAASTVVALVSVTAWVLLPVNHVIARTMAIPSESGNVLTLSEGITEVIAVTDSPGTGRTLFTNGHPMSSTDLLAQRYMRALAHIPLLSLSRPQHVLVIGFGVGNTAHAATLYPSVQRVDVVDLSRHVLDHAGYFSATNDAVLEHPRVAVHVNDDFGGEGLGLTLDREAEALEAEGGRGVSSSDLQVLPLKVAGRFFQRRLHLGKGGGWIERVGHSDGELGHGGAPALVVKTKAALYRAEIGRLLCGDGATIPRGHRRL
jgi:spermidine synthase